MIVACVFKDYCGNDVNTKSERSYNRIADGWVHPRSAGGSNHIALLTLSDQWSCSECMDKLRSNIDPAQGSLL